MDWEDFKRAFGFKEEEEKKMKSVSPDRFNSIDEIWEHLQERKEENRFPAVPDILYFLIKTLKGVKNE